MLGKRHWIFSNTTQLCLLRGTFFHQLNIDIANMYKWILKWKFRILLITCFYPGTGEVRCWMKSFCKGKNVQDSAGPIVSNGMVLNWRTSLLMCIFLTIPFFWRNHKRRVVGTGEFLWSYVHWLVYFSRQMVAVATLQCPPKLNQQKSLNINIKGFINVTTMYSWINKKWGSTRHPWLWIKTILIFTSVLLNPEQWSAFWSQNQPQSSEFQRFQKYQKNSPSLPGKCTLTQKMSSQKIRQHMWNWPLIHPFIKSQGCLSVCEIFLRTRQWERLIAHLDLGILQEFQ